MNSLQSPKRLFNSTKSSFPAWIPPGGWTARTFAVHGVALLAAMVRAKHITERRQAALAAPKLHELFRQQCRRVLAIGLSVDPMHHREADDWAQKGLVELTFPSNEHIWARALEQVFAEQGHKISVTMKPTLDATAQTAYAQTNIMLANEGRRDTVTADAIVNKLASRVARINDTTREQMGSLIGQAIKDRLTVQEGAKWISKRFDQISSARALNISRNEMANAWTQASAASMQESETIAAVSVIGCQAREANSPEYNGESTCNYEDLPIQELDALLEVGWHVNHTGTLIASQFRE